MYPLRIYFYAVHYDLGECYENCREGSKIPENASCLYSDHVFSDLTFLKISGAVAVS